MTEASTTNAAAQADVVRALFDRLTYHDIAKTIDHSLLRPELDDQLIEDGLRLAAKYDVASA